MSNWIATNELRFVERREYNTFHLHDEYKVVRILQQRWYLSEWTEGIGWECSKTEWRDVPVVEEE